MSIATGSPSAAPYNSLNFVWITSKWLHGLGDRCQSVVLGSIASNKSYIPEDGLSCRASQRLLHMGHAGIAPVSFFGTKVQLPYCDE